MISNPALRGKSHLVGLKTDKKHDGRVKSNPAVCLSPRLRYGQMNSFDLPTRMRWYRATFRSKYLSILQRGTGFSFPLQTQ